MDQEEQEDVCECGCTYDEPCPDAEFFGHLRPGLPLTQQLTKMKEVLNDTASSNH